MNKPHAQDCGLSNHSLCLHFTDEIGLHPSHKCDINPSVKLQKCLPLSILMNLANTLSTRINFKHNEYKFE